jgi:imidazolonepropionase-like amidohydrolase
MAQGDRVEPFGHPKHVAHRRRSNHFGAAAIECLYEHLTQGHTTVTAALRVASFLISSTFAQQALVAGTRAPGEFAQRHFGAQPFGLVATGHRADLVLLERNPLDDVRHARVPLAVMVRGNWIPARP